jgi:glycosyltransferase involved in cell wall biosynthesis
LPKIDEYLKEKGYSVSNLNIIPNGIDPAEWESAYPAKAEEAVNLIAAIRRSGRSVVGYAGSHGVSNALQNLIDVAKIMRHDNVMFVLVGDGPEKKDLRERSRDEKLENIVFLDAVPKSQIPGLLRSFDIAYIGWRRQPLYRFGISPNKLIDYMMAGRPILHAVVAGNDLVSEVSCGLTVPSENPAAAARGLRQLLSEDVDSLNLMGSRGREFVLNNLTYPVLAERFLDGCA